MASSIGGAGQFLSTLSTLSPLGEGLGKEKGKDERRKEGGRFTELQVQVVRNDGDPDGDGDDLAKGPAVEVDKIEGEVVVVKQALIDGTEEEHSRGGVETNGRSPGIDEHVAEVGEQASFARELCGQGWWDTVPGVEDLEAGAAEALVAE